MDDQVRFCIKVLVSSIALPACPYDIQSKRKRKSSFKVNIWPMSCKLSYYKATSSNLSYNLIIDLTAMLNIIYAPGVVASVSNTL
jgi:hypothetical protein